MLRTEEDKVQKLKEAIPELHALMYIGKDKPSINFYE
jgi:hypothetical protein